MSEAIKTQQQMENMVALIASISILVMGVALLGFGNEGGMILHGWLMLIGAGWAIKKSLDRLNEPPRINTSEYSDEVIKWGVLACFFWGVLGFTVGDILAWQLAFPSLNGDMAWTNFGRIRPIHTTAVIFGFAGNALMATSFYVVQR